ncbi:MAG: lytic transglycosylase domain-containing protein [Azoarcus sp.]|nr:lytic transglycosylase domain-containing protein [Azoarcus sp.]
MRKGDRETLEQLANEAGGHPLDSYVRYWLLFTGLAKPVAPSPEELNQFLEAEAGTLLAERLRIDWLRRMAKNGESEGFLQVYAGVQNPDSELRCMAWNARLASGDGRVLDEVAASWSSLTLAHAACTPVLRAAVERGKVSNDEAWQLFRRRVDLRSPSRARNVLAWLDSSRLKAFDQAMRGPKRYLTRLPAKFAASRAGRELALAALARLARDDVDAAHTRFLRISKRLNASERAHAWAVLALRAAQEQRPSAAAWYRNAGATPMSATQRAWRVRVALRDGQWQAVLTAIDGLNAEERALPEWVYWRGRALKALNKTSEANKAFQRIASVPDFYGILANEELGQQFDPRAAHAAPTASSLGEPVASNAALDGDAAGNGNGNGNDDAAESAGEDTTDADGGNAESIPAATSAVTGPSADKHPGFQRALALFRLDLRLEAIREWNWSLRGRDEAFRLAAARLALNNHLYDRAITSAELANPAGAWELRFLTPFREIIEPHTTAKSLDISWVYGVMRQESRFIIPSRSSTGAQGLMQVMPATGKWVAKKLGLYYHPGLLRDPETNVELGTGYMRIILDELENNAVLAAAGYNAGPSRARRWRDDSHPLEGAIYAETIPFDETRDYVKHVMANTVIYAALIEGKPQSLKARLGTILPKMD